MAARVNENAPELPVVDKTVIDRTASQNRSEVPKELQWYYDNITIEKISDRSELSETSNGIHPTTEQLLNMKLEDEKTESNDTANGIKEAPAENHVKAQEDEKTESNGIANGIKEALAENPVKAPDVKVQEVKKLKSTVAFSTETADPEDSDGNDEKPAPGDKDLAVKKPKGDKSEEEEKKKKKKRKPKKPGPTGFEEFYADPPITPAEYVEEQQILYDPDRSFPERIEVAIQRYRARRKLDSERSNILTKYMVLGGIDSGMKPFTGGLDNNLLEYGNKDDIAAFAAIDYIGTGNLKYFQPSSPEHWVVDFEGVVKGFFSHRAPRFLELHTQQGIKNCCGTIRNFLNYILLHGVCPEYTEDIMRSRIVCDQAEKELWAIYQLRNLLPGPFNTACSTMYGSSHLGENRWVPTEEEVAGLGAETFGMPEKQAQRIVKTAIALLGNEEMFRRAAANTIHVVKEESRSLEVVEIIRADPKVTYAFGEAKDFNEERGGMKPLGVLRVKNFVNPELDDEDCSEDGTDVPVDYDTTEDFWMEDDILEECFVGLKMQVDVHELNIGVKYFDTIIRLYCSFLTVLPQEKMEIWKEPDLNPRGPPTVNDPYYPDEGGNGGGDGGADDDLSD